MALTKEILLSKFSEESTYNTLRVLDGASVAAYIIRTGLIDSQHGVAVVDPSKDRSERVVFLHVPGEEDPEINDISEEIEALIEAM